MLNIVSLLLTKHGHTDKTEHGEAGFWRERGAEYAAKLFAGVERHLKEPHRNWLITDSPELCPKGVHPIYYGLQIGYAPGWWSKLLLFAGFIGDESKTLYLDLDNVVCGDLSLLVSLEPRPLIMADDIAEGGLANGSTMLCYPQALRLLWSSYVMDPIGVREQFSKWPHASDQAYIADTMAHLGIEIPRFQNLLPKGMLLNSRVELERGADYSKTSIVFGCADPKPHMSNHRFYFEHWKV